MMLAVVIPPIIPLSRGLPIPMAQKRQSMFMLGTLRGMIGLHPSGFLLATR